MASINAHTFQSIQEAQTAIELINSNEGIPVSTDSVTRTYTDYQQHDGYIYIVSDEVTTKYLGQPVIIELTEE